MDATDDQFPPPWLLAAIIGAVVASVVFTATSSRGESLPPDVPYPSRNYEGRIVGPYVSDGDHWYVVEIVEVRTHGYVVAAGSPGLLRGDRVDVRYQRGNWKIVRRKFRGD